MGTCRRRIVDTRNGVNAGSFKRIEVGKAGVLGSSGEGAVEDSLKAAASSVTEVLEGGVAIGVED